jgi:hypothetical protein
MSDEGTQQRYARLAGFTYLLNYVLVVFGTVVPAQIIGPSGFTAAAANIRAALPLYRGALASMALGWLSIVLLSLAIYVVLRPVNPRIAQLALAARLGEAFIGAITVIISFASLRLRLLFDSPAGGPTLPVEQLEALLLVANSAQASGFQIAMIFFAFGSTLSFYLFYRSAYLPLGLAGLGVFASALMMMVSLASLIFPAYATTLQYGWAPIGIAEISTAIWLLTRGIRRSPS